MLGRLKRVDRVDLGAYASCGVGPGNRRADVYVGRRNLGWVDCDVRPLNELPTYILPIVEDSDWRYDQHPMVRGLVLVPHEGVFFQRVGYFLSHASYRTKPDDSAAYQWFHKGETEMVAIK